MGRVVVVGRLAARDLRRRPVEALLLLVVIAAATTTLALGLVLHGVTDDPFARTRAATAGPDVVAQTDPGAGSGALRALAGARGVVGHGGPYPLVEATVGGHGAGAVVQVEGRDRAPAAIDRPRVVRGRWVRDGGVVVERGYAEALGVEVGERLVVGGRSLRVVGLAVSAAAVPYPTLTLLRPGRPPVHPGLAWATVADARRLASARGASLSYIMNLRLADPAAAPALVDAAPPVSVQTWQQLGAAHADLVRNERRALLTGSWLLGLLALAGVAVLVGGRMADQTRRVGLLKAVGATPALVAAVLLAEYLLLAALAAGAGLALARLVAPPLAEPGAGLLGGAGGVPWSWSTVAIVVAVALLVALVATLVPALRAARTSTMFALADAPRRPRRSARLIGWSARLPVPLLLGLRLAAGRPRRALLGVASVAVTVSGIVAALAARAQLQAQEGPTGLADPRTDRLGHVLTLITVVLIVQLAVNAIFIAWANALDARRPSALARALGATPGQVSAGLSAAQVLPTLAGTLLGLPSGLALAAAVSPDATTLPATGQLLAIVLAAPLTMAALTALPARAGARRPVADVLRSELAVRSPT